MAEYNGYPSWNAWNVSLWINNTEADYFHALELVRKHGVNRASRLLTMEYGNNRTPDGARYNRRSIYYAIRDMRD
jgi:hypothetical protein